MSKQKHTMSPTVSNGQSRDASQSQRINSPCEDTIRQRAYHNYEMRKSGKLDGNPMTDWLLAEEQVRHEFTQTDDSRT